MGGKRAKWISESRDNGLWTGGRQRLQEADMEGNRSEYMLEGSGKLCGWGNVRDHQGQGDGEKGRLEAWLQRDPPNSPLHSSLQWELGSC